jgi:hypothetical protein
LHVKKSSAFNTCIVSVKMQLVRNDDNTPLKQLLSDDFYLYLFYSGVLSGTILEVIDPVVSVNKMKQFKCRVKYIIPQTITKVKLKKAVNDIITHYNASSTFGYKLLSFTITNEIQEFGIVKSTGKVFVNVL